MVSSLFSSSSSRKTLAKSARQRAKKQRKAPAIHPLKLLFFPLYLIYAICERLYYWVIEPITYRPKLASMDDIYKLLEESPESRIEPFYQQLMKRGNTLEMIAHIEQLKKKIAHDQKVLASGGKGKFAKEYRERYEFVSASLVEHMDTVKALEIRIQEVKEQSRSHRGFFQRA